MAEVDNKAKLEGLRARRGELDEFQIGFCKKISWLLRHARPLTQQQQNFLDELYEIHFNDEWDLKNPYDNNLQARCESCGGQGMVLSDRENNIAERCFTCSGIGKIVK